MRLRHIEEDVKKLGTLRAGNSGILTEQGEFAGCCPHVAHLRQLGLEVEQPSDSTLIMFQLGVESETAVFRDLQASLPDGHVILRESDIPVKWNTSNGTPVSGRPDGVVCKQVGNATIPQYGIELKSVASFWTTREVLLRGKPKISHLIQAVHYAWKLGIPYKLSYKQYAIQSVPFWKGKKEEFPDMPWSIEPFEVTYDIDIDRTGRAWFRKEGSNVWTASVVTTQDIERFYEFVSRIPETKKLGSKLNTIDVVGTKQEYSQCARYCTVHQTFHEFEKDYDLWIEKVREYVENHKNQQQQQNTTNLE